MTGTGIILWVLAIGALVFFMFRKGGCCCGTGSGETKDQHKLGGGCCGTGSDHGNNETKDLHKGGCCCGTNSDHDDKHKGSDCCG